MKHRFLLIITLVVIAGAIWALRQTDSDSVRGPDDLSDRAVTGGLAPEFALADYSGEDHRLSDYRGVPVVLNFWASWCPFCVEEMPLFQTFYERHSGQLEIVAVNRGEPPGRARAFTEPMGLTYPLLLDEPDRVSTVYQVRAMPTTFFIDTDGVIRHIKYGPMEAEEIEQLLLQYLSIGEPGEKSITGSQSERTIKTTNGVKHSIPLDAIRSGGPPKDGIPSIDTPTFVSIPEAKEWTDTEGLGIAVSFNGEDRFYPNQVLVWHEIVNDTVGGQPALITYCPLCGTGIVFEPIVKGEVTAFGTSGKLWNSNLVMYDRQTDSYWSQVLGEAVVGEMTGVKLKKLPHDNVTFSDWAADHPDGQVLSRETGFRRDYTKDPYGSYYTDRSLYFPVEHESDLFHPKQVTFGIELNGQTKAYTQSELLKAPEPVFEDSLADVALAIRFDKKRKTIDIRRLDTDEEVVPTYGFWVSWYAVHPDTDVYRAP